MLPPPSATWAKLMLATADQALNACVKMDVKSKLRKLDRATVAPLNHVESVEALLHPAPAMLQVTVPPVVPKVLEGPHFPPPVTKSSGSVRVSGGLPSQQNSTLSISSVSAP
jgi:hypothetical protein